MAVDRTATNVWEGDLQEGSGSTSLESSGATAPLPVSFPARAGEPAGKTSPEELIAAAHASCYNMALSGALSKSVGAPEWLRTSVTVSFSREGGPHISGVALHVRGKVPGASAEDFAEAAAAAKDGCPVSKLMAGNVEIILDAALEA